jgi:D-glycero-D-manno-heptose 1,7-bisphosphate phosphatase
MTPAKAGSDRLARRAVFLDRDGVLNRPEIVDGRPHPPRRAADVCLLDGVDEACARLRDAGWLLVVVTNQPDIARGTTSLALVDAIHAVITDQIELDAVLICPHDDANACSCRKPAPGLLHQAARQFGISLPDSVIVGDRWRDVEAGRRAGCRTVFVDWRYSEPAPVAPDLTVTSLSEALPWILETRQEAPKR